MKNQFSKLLDFLNRLHQAKIHFDMRQSRDDAIMVIVYAPGEYWEIEFVADGDIDIERYRSDGRIADESILEELFALWSEPQPANSEPADHHGVIARN